MTDVYREAGHACPVCRIPMRAFQGRLVCDQCTGMLLTVADFTQSIANSGGLDLTVVDDTPSQRACPRCERLMKSCRVTVNKLELDGEILHCDPDGLWFESGLLEQVLEKVGHAGHRGASSGGRAYGGMSGNAGGNLGFGAHGMGSAMAAVDAAFARGGGNSNEILKWWEKPRPRVVTPFASALTALHLACPTCSGKLHLHGNLWGCDAGDGVFVEYEALETMLAEMANAPWETPAPTGPLGKRACPACSSAMVEQEIEAVLVDRCATHGIWFDSGELERALQHTGEPKSGWFRRVFWHR